MNYTNFENRTPDEQYKNLIREVLEKGTWSKGTMVDKDGSEVRTIDYMGATPLRFNVLKNGAPIITERDISGFYKSAIGELFGFINGARTQEELENFGCKWWKAWCTEPKCSKRGLETGDLGPGSYGAAFANFPMPDGNTFNQFEEIVKQMKERPELKTHLITPWIPYYTIRNVDHQQKVVVCPCHGWIHFRILDNKLNMLLWQRSGDILIGIPSNLTQYTALFLAMADVLGLEPNEYVHEISDAHIYEDQLQYIDEILSRENRPFPTLKLVKKRDRISDYRKDDFVLEDYHPHDKINGIPVGV